ncbi:hypothetical protein PO909_002202 [Leuciscus waleckii]
MKAARPAASSTRPAEVLLQQRGFFSDPAMTAVLELDEKVQVLMREKSEERSSQDRHNQEQLNRNKLDPPKKKLDEGWVNFKKNMRTQSLPKQHNVAGLKKPMPILPLDPVQHSHTSSLSYFMSQKDQEHSQSCTCRSCGGKHTLTFSRSPNRIQHYTHLIQSDKTEEVTLIGSDGKVYKG